MCLSLCPSVCLCVCVAASAVCLSVTFLCRHAAVSLAVQLVHALELDEEHTVELDATGSVTMRVTLIDANHCPGAVMFLLSSYWGTHLHTGDFRFHPSMLLHPALHDVEVSMLFLDNSFCDPACVFPAPEVAVQRAAAIIKTHADHDVVIAIDTLGKERFLLELARVGCVRLFVWRVGMQCG